MIIREINNNELRLLGINHKIKHSIVINNDINNGFIIVRDLAGLNEVIKWELSSDYSLLFRAVKRKVGPLVTIEPEGSDRLRILKEAGFRVIKKISGLYPNNKALILKLD